MGVTSLIVSQRNFEQNYGITASQAYKTAGEIAVSYEVKLMIKKKVDSEQIMYIGALLILFLVDNQ